MCRRKFFALSRGSNETGRVNLQSSTSSSGRFSLALAREKRRGDEVVQSCVNNARRTLARVPRKPISANRGLNLANRGIHFVPRFDPVPESMINFNLGIN